MDDNSDDLLIGETVMIVRVTNPELICLQGTITCIAGIQFIPFLGLTLYTTEIIPSLGYGVFGPRRCFKPLRGGDGEDEMIRIAGKPIKETITR